TLTKLGRVRGRTGHELDPLSGNRASNRPGAVQRGDRGFSVEVRASESVGESVIPGTDGMHAKAKALAVVSPRCDIDPDVEPTERVSFQCPDGVTVDLEVGDLDEFDLPDPSELFLVHLAG
ncbi:hypothetical protein ABT400_27700, partial [Streptomyces albidoflavus]